MDFNTTLLHHNFESERSTGSTLTPIYQVSAFSQESAEKLEAVFNNRAPGFAYTRIGNPRQILSKGALHRSKRELAQSPALRAWPL